MRLVIENGGLNIDQISLQYIDSWGRTPAPTISPPGGIFYDSIAVTITSTIPNALIQGVHSSPYTYTLTESAEVEAWADAPGLPPGWPTLAYFVEGTSPAITIQAEDYDEGAKGVAYHDTTPGNTGGHYRSDDVDIWKYGLNQYYTGANATGEWLEYTFENPERKNYCFDIRVATPNDDRRLHVEIDGMDVTGSLHVPNTGGWINWQTLFSGYPFALDAGPHVMRLVIENGGLNIDRIRLVEFSPVP